MLATAHLIYDSLGERFKITYAVKKIAKEEIKSVGYNCNDYDELIKKHKY